MIEVSLEILNKCEQDVKLYAKNLIDVEENVFMKLIPSTYNLPAIKAKYQKKAYDDLFSKGMPKNQAKKVSTYKIDTLIERLLNEIQ